MAAASRCISWQLRFAPARRKRTKDKWQGQRQLAPASGTARSSAEAAPQGVPFPQAENNFGRRYMPAQVRFSILETSDRVHAKSVRQEGRSSEWERRPLKARVVAGPQARERISETADTILGMGNHCPARRMPAAQIPGGELYIMKDGRCEAQLDDEDVACGCAGLSAMQRTLT